MKKILLSTAALIAIAGSASAADLPSIKSAPAPAPIMTWTGFYAGLNVGAGTGSSPISISGLPYDTWGQANNDFHKVSAPTTNPWWNTVTGLIGMNSQSRSISQLGVIGGLQLGYNYQFSNNIVVGAETDFQGSSINGNTKINTIGNDTLYTSLPAAASSRGYAADRNMTQQTNISSSIDWFGTVRGKVGYLITPSIFTYATGGLTYAGVSASTQTNGGAYVIGTTSVGAPVYQGNSPIIGPSVSTSTTLVGWNVGGGAEWMIRQNWSIKAEAFYYNLGNWNLGSNVVGLQTPTTNSQQFPTWISSNSTKIGYNGVVARLGVNYHFNFANIAPVVAKF
jgi:outer membrane immunogenic protein